MVKLIIGLGNPGDKFTHTRHNLGFEVLDHLIHKLGLSRDSWQDNKKLKSQICKTRHLDQDLILAKPQTYMNNSGQGVRLLMDFYKLTPTDLIIIHDDLDLIIGQIKLRQGGAAAGHHGVESIIDHLGSDDFIRLRLGIGPEAHSGLAKLAEHHKSSMNIDHFVTTTFDPHEKSKIKHMLKRALEATLTLLDKGLKPAQNQYH